MVKLFSDIPVSGPPGAYKQRVADWHRRHDEEELERHKDDPVPVEVKPDLPVETEKTELEKLLEDPEAAELLKKLEELSSPEVSDELKKLIGDV